MPSELIAFRLNPGSDDYPDDGRAFAVLLRWRRKGHKDRETFTKALLALDGEKVPQPNKDAAIARLIRLADRLETMIETLQAMDRSPAIYTDGENAGKPVNFGIMETILGSLQRRVNDDDD